MVPIALNSIIRLFYRRTVIPFFVFFIAIQYKYKTIWAFKSAYIPSSTLRNSVRSNPLFVSVVSSSTDSSNLPVVDANTNDDNDVSTIIGTIQILMSDTGGGHRASAIALQDAFHTLYPPSTRRKIHCDIVDIYTEYGPIWPYNDYVSIYKYMAAHPWMWKLLYEFGQSDFGLWFNQFMLELFCTEAFTKCINRIPPLDNNNNKTPSPRQRRADMIVSVHPLTQDLPLKILSKLDDPNGNGPRTTPFVTVVTDLGSAHPTWFNPGYVS